MQQRNDAPELGAKLLQAIHKETLMQSPLPLRAEATEVLGRAQVLVEANVVDGDRFSHVLGHFAARVDADAGAPGTGKRERKRDAKVIAQQLAERVSYLPEALQVVEAQPDDSILMRSSPGSMRGRGADYFEAMVREDGFDLRRYAPRALGGGRDGKAFCLPDDTLARLADDVGAILGA